MEILQTMVHIYYCRLGQQLNIEALSGLMKCLPELLREQVLKFRKWEDQQRCLFGKLLLLRALTEAGFSSSLLKDLKYTRYHRPYINDSVDFNISHSGDYIVCAISLNQKIGIDIEEIKEIPLNGFENEFSTAEWAAVLAGADSLRSFYILWTQKESFLKAIGSGLNLPLNQVLIDDSAINWNNKKWFLQEIPLDQQYISYLATEMPRPKTKIVEVML